LQEDLRLAEIQAGNNKYAQLLKKQGSYVINVEGVDWYEYSGFMTPVYLPHCVPAISEQAAKEVLKQSGRPFIRWDTKFGQVQPGEWWYILKKGTWSIDDVKDKKKRWMIRQGKKGFNVRPMDFEEVIKFCPQVALAAAARYKGKADIETREILEKRTGAAKDVPGVLEYSGCFQGDKLVSFSENYIQENAVWLATIRHDPEYLKGYSSYGLMDGILEYYLNEKKFLYVLDGCRSIHHKTQFQEHLLDIFNFTKEYSCLNVVYSTFFGALVKTAYPFRNFFWRACEKTNNGLVANISAVLKQEHIRRACQLNSINNTALSNPPAAG
jgi:hypothetical protein